MLLDIVYPKYKSGENNAPLKFKTPELLWRTQNLSLITLEFNKAIVLLNFSNYLDMNVFLIVLHQTVIVIFLNLSYSRLLSAIWLIKHKKKNNNTNSLISNPGSIGI